MDCRLSALREGVEIEQALGIVLSACSKFVPEDLIRPHLDELRPLLSNPITVQEAHALTFVALKRCDIKDVVTWLRDSSEGWLSYIDRERRPLSDEELKKIKERWRQQAIIEYGLDGLQGGIRVETALRLFRGACNKSDTLRVPEHRMDSCLDESESSLSNPITADQAQALCDAVFEECELKTVLDWLEGSPMPWRAYFEGKRWLAAEEERQQEEAQLVQLRKLNEKAEKEWRPKSLSRNNIVSPMALLEEWSSSNLRETCLVVARWLRLLCPTL